MGILLGLTAALSWGVGDFMARFSTRRIGTYRTLLYMQILGLLMLSAALTVMHGWVPLTVGIPRQAFAWLILAGLVNTVSSLMLYRAFETGMLAIVSPIAASYPVLTVALSLASGEKLGPARGLGIAAALIGVILAATSFAPAPEVNPAAHHHKGHLTRGVAWAICAAVGYGVLFWILGFRVMPAFGGAISVWFIRLISFITLAVLVVPVKQSAALPTGSTWWLVLGVAVTDTGAFVCNNVALKTEQVAVASVLSSLYGAVTVLLAAVFLRERLEWSQWIGIVLIFAGIALVSV